MAELIQFPTDDSDEIEPKLLKFFDELDEEQRNDLDRVSRDVGVRPQRLFVMCLERFIAEVDANGGRIPLYSLPEGERSQGAFGGSQSKPTNITQFRPET